MDEKEKKTNIPRILIVEDETLIANKIKMQLIGLGYSVCGIARSSKETLIQIEKLSPSVLLIDSTLKGDLDGIQTAHLVKRAMHMPIIFMTANPESMSIEEAKKISPFNYIHRPFEIQELYAAVERALYRHRIEVRLRESEQWLSTTLMSIVDGVIATDAEGNVKFMNPVAEKMTGWNQSDALGKLLFDGFVFVDEKGTTQLNNPIHEILQQHTVLSPAVASFLQPKSENNKRIAVEYTASPIKDDGDTVIGAVLVFRDITERKTYEKRIYSLAYHDQLTGLPNRLQFSEKLIRMLRVAQKKKTKFAVLFLDLDKFKKVNDSHGHTLGDQLLIETANRLAQCIRKRDIVSRQGGDEFTIILHDIQKKKDAVIVAEKIIQTLSLPMHLGRYVIRITPSIGVALFPKDGNDFEKLLMHADNAMYVSKRKGGNKYAFYEKVHT